MTSIPVILNPTAGGGRLLRHRLQLSAEARRLGVELDWRPTSAPRDAEALARAAAEDGCPLVLAWGGDGTYNEVARGLLGSTTSLGIVPGGTTSVLAYELGVPRPAPVALEPLLAGEDRPMRVGRSDRDDTVLLMLSAGPDAIIVEEAFRRRRRNNGRVGIAIQGVRELLARRPLPRLQVRTDGGEVEGGWVIVGNATRYAGPFRATPGADPFAPGFEVIVHRGVGRRTATGFALGIVLGRHTVRPDVVRTVATQVTIEPVDQERVVPYQVDGDPVVGLPVTVEVDERKLLVRVPRVES